MHDNQAPVKTGLLKFLRESVGGQFVIPVYQRNYLPLALIVSAIIFLPDLLICLL